MVETIVMGLQQELAPAVRNIVADESSAIAERMETDMQAKFDGVATILVSKLDAMERRMNDRIDGRSDERD